MSTSAIGSDSRRLQFWAGRVRRARTPRRVGGLHGPLVKWLSIVLIAFAAPVTAAPPSEAEVKAVFLFNFSQFISWPANRFSTSESPLVICVLGYDPFGRTLDAAVSGERAGTHPLAVRRVRGVSEIDACHILFVDRSEATRLDEIVRSVRGRGTLTVSDAEHAAMRGVMIDFAMVDRRVRLEINLAEAEASGLTLSSKLLRPSQIVKTRET